MLTLFMCYVCKYAFLYVLRWEGLPVLTLPGVRMAGRVRSITSHTHTHGRACAKPASQAVCESPYLCVHQGAFVIVFVFACVLVLVFVFASNISVCTSEPCCVSLTHSLTHSLTRSLTPSRTHSRTHSLTHSLTHSPLVLTYRSSQGWG